MSKNLSKCWGYGLWYKKGLDAYAGYAAATAIGVERVVSDRHHWYDVVAGAGIGFGAAELTWWLSDLMFGKGSKMLLATHPVFCELSHHISVNPVALAQHYGLTTEYLDITNSKWVAAFFASTRYDYNTDTYHPVGRDYEEGYGVMYISKPYEAGGATDGFFSKNVVIGYQYFKRPTKQSSFGYKMQMGQDFNESPYFERVFFRHDLDASKLVYEMSYKQHRFIPKDSLSRLARQIAESNEVTRKALERCLQMCYRDKEISYLEEVCKSKGLVIRDDNRAVAQFGREEQEADWKAWSEFGRADLQMRILPPIAVTELKVDE